MFTMSKGYSQQVGILNNKSVRIHVTARQLIVQNLNFKLQKKN